MESEATRIDQRNFHAKKQQISLKMSLSTLVARQFGQRMGFQGTEKSGRPITTGQLHPPVVSRCILLFRAVVKSRPTNRDLPMAHRS